VRCAEGCYRTCNGGVSRAWSRTGLLADQPEGGNSLVGRARGEGRALDLGRSPRMALCPLMGRSGECARAPVGRGEFRFVGMV
jgi:hypothetical protein